MRSHLSYLAKKKKKKIYIKKIEPEISPEIFYTSVKHVKFSRVFSSESSVKLYKSKK